MSNDYYPNAPVLLQYRPPQPPAPRFDVLWRVLTLLSAICGPPAAVITGFAALITWSGCFIGCAGADHTNGALLGVLAAVFLFAGPVLAVTLVRTRAWVVGTSVLPAFVSAGTLLLVLSA